MTDTSHDLPLIRESELRCRELARGATTLGPAAIKAWVNALLERPREERRGWRAIELARATILEIADSARRSLELEVGASASTLARLAGSGIPPRAPMSPAPAFEIPAEVASFELGVDALSSIPLLGRHLACRTLDAALGRPLEHAFQNYGYRLRDWSLAELANLEAWVRTTAASHSLPEGA